MSYGHLGSILVDGTMGVKTLKIVVASPGDVQAERDLLEEVVEELNRGVAADRGLRLEVIRWETDAYPGFHPEGPQGLIDPILRIEDSDILIGIFWKRFGTPTKDARSGAEHEIREAYEAWKPTQIDHRQQFFQESSRRADKGASEPVLLSAGAFPNEH